MLFDLRSPGRRRVIKVIYATLALLMGGGLVFFGIGSDVQGGLFDVFGERNGANASQQLEDQAENLEERLRRNPQDEQLLLAVVRTRYSAGNAGVTIDETTGQQSFSEDSFTHFRRAARAWDRYMALDPEDPRPLTANLAAQAAFYAAAGSTNAGDFTRNIETALSAQQVFTAARPSVNSLTTLAQYAYYAGNFEQGDRAARQAEEAAPQGFRRQVSRALEAYRREGRAVQRQIEAAAAEGRSSLEDPLGGLSGGGALAPAAP